MLTKILRASDTRKTRLHDGKGNLIPSKRLLANGPRAVASGLLRITVNARPQRPWISYTATNRLARFLTKEKTVLEFGSGMSTIWYARRAGKVLSIESYEPWYNHVSKLLKHYNIKNVDYRFASNEEEYSAVPSEYREFDLIMVDGVLRDRCTAASIEFLRPGGIFYLDNSDRMAIPGSPEEKAGEIARTYAEKHSCSIDWYTDFAPTQFFVQEGMLLQRPKH